jgi:hypothetical protein
LAGYSDSKEGTANIVLFPTPRFFPAAQYGSATADSSLMWLFYLEIVALATKIGGKIRLPGASSNCIFWRIMA